MARCKVGTQLYQKTLGKPSHYRDFVQCQSGNWQTWHVCFNVQRDEEEDLFYQGCGAWVLVLPRQHQALCEWQQKLTSYGLAYSTQHMAIQDKNQYLNGEGIVTRVHHVPIMTSHNAHVWTSSSCPPWLWKKKEMGVLQTHVLWVHISIQGELQQRQVRPHSNTYLQRGHATTWACQFCWTQIVMLVYYSLLFQNVSWWHWLFLITMVGRNYVLDYYNKN